MTDATVRRIDFGYFVRPASETGTGAARVEPCLGYLVEHPGGLLLVDTGMAEHPDVDAKYRPRRIPLPAALAAAGVELRDVRHVVNCHLHFDHCGGNAQLAGRAVYAQAAEMSAARTAPGYLRDCVDVPGVTYTELDGEAEILPGVSIVPTPGHTAGHQSVVVRRRDGVVVVAGQSHDTATAYGADALALRAVDEGDMVAPVPAWMDTLRRFDPARVVFAHDNAVWEP